MLGFALPAELLEEHKATSSDARASIRSNAEKHAQGCFDRDLLCESLCLSDTVFNSEDFFLNLAFGCVGIDSANNTLAFVATVVKKQLPGRLGA